MLNAIAIPKSLEQICEAREKDETDEEYLRNNFDLALKLLREKNLEQIAQRDPDNIPTWKEICRA